MPKTASSQSFDPTQADTVRPYLERILRSEAFRKAPNLRHLLEYLVAKSNEGQTDQIKESVIAIDVFGRRPDFDGRIDNIVRVQAHRLRKLLDAYYLDEGKDEDLRLAVPRGGYIPQFLPVEKVAVNLPAVETPIVTTHSESTVPGPHKTFPFVKVAIFAGVFAAGLLTAFLLNGTRRSPRADATVSELWLSIFEPGVKMVVSYTNPVFLRVGRSQTYLRYEGPLSAPFGAQINVSATDSAIDPQYANGKQPLYFNDGWTGTGEVLAVNRLTELAGHLEQSINVIPSRSLTLDSVHSNTVLFLGSPWMNGVLAQIGNENTPMYNTNDGRILIRNPQNGEQAEYKNSKDPVTSEVKSCYALFSVLPGISASHRVISSAGIGTLATWAAIEFLTTPTGAAQVLKALRADGGAIPQFYQAVIKAEIVKGSVSRESLIATRVVQASDLRGNKNR